MDQYIVYLIAAPIAAGVTFLLAIITARAAAENFGAQILTAYLSVVTGLVVFNVLELVSPTPQGTYFWASANYIFITATPVIWFSFILVYTGRLRWLQGKYLLLWWLPPTVTALLAFTNGWHHLIWTEITYVPVHRFLAMQVSHGLAFWLFAVYAYALYVGGSLIVLREFLPSQRLYRVQSKWLLLGSVGPLLANLVYIFHLIPGLTKDFSPIVFALAGIAFAVAMFKHRLFDLMPVARAVLIEKMSDGVFVLDTKGRLVDVNPAGERIFRAQRRLAPGDLLANFLSLPSASDKILALPFQGGEMRYYQAESTPLTGERGQQTGQLVVLRDVTEQTIGRQALERIRRELETRVAEGTAELQALHANLEARVHQRTRFLTAVYEVLALVSSTGDRDEMLAHVLQAALTALNADLGLIHLRSESDDLLELVVHAGLTPSEAAWAAQASLWEALAARAQPWDSAQGAWDEDPGADFRLPHALAAPIPVNGCSRGVLTLMRRATAPWQETDVQVATAIAEQIGIGLKMKSLNEQARQAAIQRERARLGRDLHDSVMQLLYSQLLFSEAAQKSLGQNQPAQSEQYLGRVGAIADQAVREMRLLLYQLRPMALSAGGLQQALKARLEVVEERAGVQTDLNYRVAERLPEVVETALYRIAEEALNNALKHAQADRVTVRVESEGDEVGLQVSDNGRGFDLNDLHSGLGLQSMQERSASLHGRFSLKTTPGGGTRVIAHLPLRLPGAAEEY